MDIQYLGHSSFRISNRDVSVVTDPFDPKSVGFRFPKVSATIVTLSHGHDDHNYVDGVDDVKKVIDGPGEYEIDGISVLGFSSFHDDKKGEERGKNTIYKIEFEKFSVVHLGDLGHKLSEKVVSSLGEVDVLMVPVGGVYTIGPTEAVEVFRMIEPKITIPMHYNALGINKEVFGELEDISKFTNEISLDAKEESKLSLKKGSILPDEQQLIVLNRK